MAEEQYRFESALKLLLHNKIDEVNYLKHHFKLIKSIDEGIIGFRDKDTYGKTLLHYV